MADRQRMEWPSRRSECHGNELPVASRFVVGAAAGSGFRDRDALGRTARGAAYMQAPFLQAFGQGVVLGKPSGVQVTSAFLSQVGGAAGSQALQM